MLPNQTQATPEPSQPNPAEPTKAEGVTPATFEDWLEKQEPQVKELYETHSEALMNTVRATRKERDDLARQIKELAKTQAEGSEARKALDEMSVKLEVTEKKADFFEQAMKPELQCRNAKAAWLLAQASNLFDRKGNPDWDAIRAEAPELFGVNVANANAGAGTGNLPPAKKSMNDFIRQAAGRGG